MFSLQRTTHCSHLSGQCLCRSDTISGRFLSKWHLVTPSPVLRGRQRSSPLTTRQIDAIFPIKVPCMTWWSGDTPEYAVRRLAPTRNRGHHRGGITQERPDAGEIGRPLGLFSMASTAGSGRSRRRGMLGCGGLHQHDTHRPNGADVTLRDPSNLFHALVHVVLSRQRITSWGFHAHPVLTEVFGFDHLELGKL